MSFTTPTTCAVAPSPRRIVRAQGIAVRPVRPGHRGVDDRHDRRVGPAIRGVEGAAAQQPDAHHLEVARPHDVVGHGEHRLAVRRRVAVDGDLALLVVAAQRHHRGSRGRAYAGQTGTRAIVSAWYAYARAASSPRPLVLAVATTSRDGSKPTSNNVASTRCGRAVPAIATSASDTAACDDRGRRSATGARLRPTLAAAPSCSGRAGSSRAARSAGSTPERPVAAAISAAAQAHTRQSMSRRGAKCSRPVSGCSARKPSRSHTAAIRPTPVAAAVIDQALGQPQPRDDTTAGAHRHAHGDLAGTVGDGSQLRVRDVGTCRHQRQGRDDQGEHEHATEQRRQALGRGATPA